MNPSIRPLASSEMRNAGAPDEIKSSQGSSIVDIVRVRAKNKCLIAVCALVSVVVTISHADFVKSVYEATATIRVDPLRAGENSQHVALPKPAEKFMNVFQRAGGIC
jgi:uncharacterized protein involved in exopolysaccharide biosynthesis